MKEYLSRVVDQILEERLASKGAVLVEGPKFCGKTTTTKRLAKDSLTLDRPDRMEHYQALGAIAPEQLLKGKPPVLLDEWETVPGLLKAVCNELDQKEGRDGRFILTRSIARTALDFTLDSEDADFKKTSRIVMRPMSLFESQESTGSISLKSLFEGVNAQSKSVTNSSVKSTAHPKTNLTATSSANSTHNYMANSEAQVHASLMTNSTTLDDIAYFICRGGWPRALGMASRSALQQAKKYIHSLTETNLNAVDGIKRDPDKVRGLLESYAHQVGTPSSLEAIRKDMLRSPKDTFDQVTLYAYLKALEQTFTVEDLQAWQPHLRTKTVIRTTPIRFFVDPSLATAALGLTPRDLMNDLVRMDGLFKNLCIRDLRVYAETLNASLSQYRDRTGLACDAVVQRRDGSYGLVNIRLGGETAIDEAAQILHRLATKLDFQNMQKPAFLAVLCAIAPSAYQREDGIWIVPVTNLGP